MNNNAISYLEIMLLKKAIEDNEKSIQLLEKLIEQLEIQECPITEEQDQVLAYARSKRTNAEALVKAQHNLSKTHKLIA